MVRSTLLVALLLVTACSGGGDTGDTGSTSDSTPAQDAVSDTGDETPADATSGSDVHIVEDADAGPGADQADASGGEDAAPDPEDVGEETPDVAEDTGEAAADVDEMPDAPDAADETDDVEGDVATPDAPDTMNDTGPDVVEPTGPVGPCPLNQRVGRFDIADHGLYAAVNGNVADGVIPLTVLQPVGEEGDCVLLMKTNPFCDPPCAAGELCDHDNSCKAFPANKDIGTVTVDGLKVPVSIEPNLAKDYWDTTLPPEPWEVGAQVTFSTSGGDYPAFSLEVEGVEPLVGGEPKWTVNEGEDTVIEWEPADGPGRMWLTLNVDQHGITPVTLFCETEDTGKLTIDKILVDQFIAFGVTGFAVGQLRRRSIDSIFIEPGCVEVSLFSPWVAQPVVEGHTPCNTDFDCPEGQKCNAFINTCVDE